MPPTSRQPRAVHHTRPTFDEFGQEVRGPFRLFDPVPLHDLSVSVDPDVPGSTRLGLPVQDGRVGDVVVLEHTLLELTLRCEVLLEHTHTCIRSGEKNNKFEVSVIFYLCYYLYIYLAIAGDSAGNGRKWGPHFIVTGLQEHLWLHQHFVRAHTHAEVHK